MQLCSNMNKLTRTGLSKDQSIGLLLTSNATEKLINEASRVLINTKLHSKSRSKLKNQQTNSKIGNARMKYICNTCGAGYKEKRRLNRHMMKHTGEYPFECSICGQNFVIDIFGKDILNCLLQMHHSNAHFVRKIL